MKKMGKPGPNRATRATRAEAQRAEPASRRKSFPIVGIGASAGGLEAFSRLLQSLPLGTGMAFVLVQHLDPAHESVLAALLARCASLPVCEITDNQRVEPDHIYVIPPNASLAITHGRLRLQKRKDSDQAQRVIDSFLVSLAQDQHERAIAVVLSGTASDGTAGLEAIKAEGGITFAQDETAKYDSMPRSAVAAGCVDLVLSPEGIALEAGAARQTSLCDRRGDARAGKFSSRRGCAVWQHLRRQRNRARGLRTRRPAGAANGSGLPGNPGPAAQTLDH